MKMPKFETVFDWVVGMAIFAILLVVCSQARCQAPDTFYEAGQAILAQRNLIDAGAVPSAVTPVITKLEQAMNAVGLSQFVGYGVTTQAGYPFPAPSATTSPSAYKSQAIAALAASQGMTTDPSTLRSIKSALFYSQYIDISPRIYGDFNKTSILWDFMDADYNLSQEEGVTIPDIAQDSLYSRSLMDGLWQVCEWVRVQGFIAFALSTGEKGFSVPSSRNGVNCINDPNGCAVQVLTFPAQSSIGQEHGIPYYFRTGMDRFSNTVLSPNDATMTLRFHPRAWSAFDDAAYRLSILPGEIQ